MWSLNKNAQDKQADGLLCYYGETLGLVLLCSGGESFGSLYMSFLHHSFGRPYLFHHCQRSVVGFLGISSCAGHILTSAGLSLTCWSLILSVRLLVVSDCHTEATLDQGDKEMMQDSHSSCILTLASEMWVIHIMNLITSNVDNRNICALFMHISRALKGESLNKDGNFRLRISLLSWTVNSFVASGPIFLIEMHVKESMFVATATHMSWLSTFWVSLRTLDINAAAVPELVMFMQTPCSAVGL